MNYRAYRRCEHSWYFVKGFDSLKEAIKYLADFHAGVAANIRNIRGELVWKSASNSKKEGN